ncbi:hypothetical protein GCM10020255_042090 [Rhodococcus baikonurensis]
MRRVREQCQRRGEEADRHLQHERHQPEAGGDPQFVDMLAAVAGRSFGGEIPCPCPCDIEGPFVDVSLDTYAYMRNSACLKNYAT